MGDFGLAQAAHSLSSKPISTPHKDNINIPYELAQIKTHQNQSDQLLWIMFLMTNNGIIGQSNIEYFPEPPNSATYHSIYHSEIQHRMNGGQYKCFLLSYVF